MAGFNKVLLCVTEDDDAAIRYVARLAAETGADLTIADVIEEQAGEINIVLPASIEQDELPDELLDLASGGIGFSSFVLYGPNDAPSKPRR